jgi:hypothetical protein
MASFSDYLNILPDPNNPIGDAGQSLAVVSGGSLGPGYASVQLSSEQPTMIDRTNSGRVVARALVGHKWNVQIGYNPMTRAEFEPVYNFLLHKRGRLRPFYVSLPQYRLPQDSSFASFVQSATLTIDGAQTAGVDTFEISSATTLSGAPKPGDLFTITDSADSNHTKAYMVTRVETNANYQSGDQPSTSQYRIHFTPGLQRSTTNGSEVVFNNPLIRVILAQDIQEYSLGTNNLYSFSLRLEEAQP